jgi:ParB family chromosome partitioning protein
MQPSHVPLSQLSIDEKVNVRKTGRGSEPMYVGSIRAKGIIMPLTVRLNGKGYKITDGGKRYDTLVWMRDNGATAGPAKVPVTDSFPVPIIIRDEDDKEAKDTSLMTNIVRAGMHPVDEYEAFAGLRDDGMSEEEIGARYGLKAKEVRQRLALGRLSPTIRAAWRDGTITAEQAMAYTIASSHKAQDAFFKKNGTDRWNGSAGSVREAFRGKHDDVGRFVAFVGIDAVRAAGIKVEEDLFGTDHRAADPNKVAALAKEKLDAECQRLIDEGWSWALPKDDPAIARISYLNSIAYRQRKLTPEETQRVADLRKIAGDDDVYQDELTTEQLEAQTEIDAIEAAAEARMYKPAERAKSGCVVSISDTGTLEISYGKMLPAEERRQKVEAKKKERKKKGLSADTPDVSGAVAWDLGMTLTRAAAKAVVAQPDLAVRFALIGLLASGYGGTSIGLKNDGAGARNVERSMEEDDAIAAVAKLTQAECLTLLAQQVGASFSFASHNKDQVALKHDDVAIHVCNAIDPKAMNAALRETFDAGNYFERVPAALILKAIAEAVNDDEARRVGKLKKKDIVAFAIENVTKTGWMPPELRTKHYDGPGAEAAVKKPTKAKAAKKKAKRR